MILIGASMKIRKYLLGLFSFFFITTIFAERNRVLWDFGLVINTSVNQSAPAEIIKSIPNLGIDPSSQARALIADPFIPPTLISIAKKNKGHDTPTFGESWDESSLENIYQVKLLAGRLTMQNNYQLVIDMISQINFSQLDDNDCLDLNYWLANAFLHAGQYTEAEDIILANMALAMNDRFHFLLAMTYEFHGRLQKAREEYLKFINQFPKSDYKVTALIKARTLDRFK